MDSDYEASGDSDNDSKDDESLWCIDDDLLFYPLGLVNHDTGTGNSAYAVWGEHYLLNFVFKYSRESRRIKMKRVRLPVPLDVHGDQEEIRNLLILELNTLLLMSSGRVYYFSSVKSFHPVPWLDGVRTISVAPGGFSVIRLLSPENKLFVEIYSDVAHLGKTATTLQQRYDITYHEENLFNCKWMDDRLTLLTLAVNGENVEFFQALLQQQCDLSDVKIVHFFTVSGNIFALVATENCMGTDTPKFHIQLLQTYASDVELIQCVTVPCRMFIVFLQCGMLVMWRWSATTKTLARTPYFTGSRYTDYEFVATEDRTTFYYTNDERVSQMNFQYDAKTQSCFVQETHKALPGILAITWVPTMQRLVCLSCNNIFYQLAFDESKNNASRLTDTLQPCAEYESHDDLFELTPAKIEQLLTQARVFDELTHLPAQLNAAIEAEYTNRQLIAVSSKTHIYRSLLSARLEFSMAQPSANHCPSSSETVFLYTGSFARLQCNALFALVHLRIAPNEIFETTWLLHITYGGILHQIIIPSALLHHQLILVLPLIRPPQERLPNFMFKLVAFVFNEMEYRAVTLPFEATVTAATYANLFRGAKSSQTLNAEYRLDDLIEQFAQSALADPLPPTSLRTAWCYKQSIYLPKSCDFSVIRDLFDSANRSTLVTVDDDQVDVYFMSTSTISLTYLSDDRSIRFQCADVGALYHAKLYLMHGLIERAARDEATSNFSTILRDMFLKYKCDIERNSGDLMQNDDNMESTILRLETLKIMYKKLRNEA